MKVRLQFIIILVMLAGAVSSESCNRRPQGAIGEPSPVDENFQILIDGNPSTYIPSQRYHISLSCADSLKFMSFTLIVKSVNASNLSDDMVGHFEITDIADTKFSVQCKNMVESTNTNTKQRINVDWIAPSNIESGCVLIQAAVVQHRNVWFINDGFLTKRICPEEIDDINIQTPSIEFCCACDEAKYEVVLERKWTRNTHAKDFPADEYRTRFSEVIGASHTFDYRFWKYGSSASTGLKLMAEHGSTRVLEKEISADSAVIRTIIKAPGIKFRKNVRSTTLANVRVDSQHHVISLVTKIDPSPDWVLGVAGLELCLSNCTWIDSKVLNLYPWDIGTDEGPTYTSPDQPQRPPDVVRRLTSTFPSDRRSPFFDEDGAPMKPLATLHITRKKLYERECGKNENVPMECTTHPWNSWTECTTKCGAGKKSRSRAYKNPSLAQRVNCNTELNQEEDCTGSQCGDSAECQLTQWSWWSPCSGECGHGYKTRTRDYVNPSEREICQVGGEDIELKQTMNCLGNCGGDNIPLESPGQFGGIESFSYYKSVPEENIERIRKIKDENGRLSITAESSDPNQYTVVQKHCLKKPSPIYLICNEQNNFKNYWFYDAEIYQCGIFTTNGCDDNRNKFESLESCEKDCQNPHKNLEKLKQRGDGGRGGADFNRHYAGDMDESQPLTRNRELSARRDHSSYKIQQGGGGGDSFDSASFRRW